MYMYVYMYIYSTLQCKVSNCVQDIAVPFCVHLPFLLPFIGNLCILLHCLNYRRTYINVKN